MNSLTSMDIAYDNEVTDFTVEEKHPGFPEYIPHESRRQNMV